MSKTKENDFFILNSAAVAENAIARIKRIDIKSGLTLTIKKQQDVRSAQQHKLKWAWMQQIQKEMAGRGRGWSAQAWNDFFKGRYMSDLLMSQDDEYRFYFDGCNLQYPTAKDKAEFYRLVGKPLATADLTVKNMSEFMNRIDFACQKKGIILLTPENN